MQGQIAFASKSALLFTRLESLANNATTYNAGEGPTQSDRTHLPTNVSSMFSTLASRRFATDSGQSRKNLTHTLTTFVRVRRLRSYRLRRAIVRTRVVTDGGATW